MSAVAMTDHGNLFGAMDFYSSVQASGLKPIIGCEVYVAPGSRLEKSSRNGEQKSYHLILLCENEKGYRNLCKLVTAGYFEGFYYKPRIDKELLEKHSEGLICLSGCLSGELADLALAGDERKLVQTASWFRDVFSRERYYLELQENGLEEQRRVNQTLIDLSTKLDIKLVATNDCHYLDQADHRAHEILLCVQTGKLLEDASRMSFDSDQFFFKSPERMATDFREVPEAIKNTRVIAERCSLLLEFGQVHMPRFDLGTGETLRERFASDARNGLKVRIEKALSSGTWLKMRRRNIRNVLNMRSI